MWLLASNALPVWPGPDMSRYGAPRAGCSVFRLGYLQPLPARAYRSQDGVWAATGHRSRRDGFGGATSRRRGPRVARPRIGRRPRRIRDAGPRPPTTLLAHYQPHGSTPRRHARALPGHVSTRSPLLTSVSVRERAEDVDRPGRVLGRAAPSRAQAN